MKTIPVEQLGAELSAAIEQQDEHEAIRLTKNADTVAWLLRVPHSATGAATDTVQYTIDAAGRTTVIVQPDSTNRPTPHVPRGAPVFGAGRGSLTIISDDDEHLKDFQEYME